jgi:hypothetical protein
MSALRDLCMPPNTRLRAASGRNFLLPFNDTDQFATQGRRSPCNIVAQAPGSVNERSAPIMTTV